MNFFQKLIDSGDSANSKLFAGLVMLALIIIMVVMSFFIDIQIEVLYAIMAFDATLFGLGSIPFKSKV